MTTDGKVVKVAALFAALFGMGLAGCAQYMAMVREGNQAQGEREDAMRTAARVEDGHAFIDGGSAGPFYPVQQLPPGAPWKTCVKLTRYVLEPGESRAAMSYQGSLVGTVQPLIDQGALSPDRFYVGAGSTQFIVSVPASERAELARNMEEGAVCIWSAGTLTKFPCPHDKSSSCSVYYTPLEKWDGVLRHAGGVEAPGGAGPGGATPAGAGGGTTTSDGANPSGATAPAATPPTAANPLLGTWRSDKVASVTMEFRADEFRWMAMLSTIRKVRYEVDGANVLVIQTEGGGQIERFRIIDANHMVHLQPGAGESPFTRVSGGIP